MKNISFYKQELEDKKLMLETIRDERDKVLLNLSNELFERDVAIRHLVKEIRNLNEILDNEDKNGR